MRRLFVLLGAVAFASAYEELMEPPISVWPQPASFMKGSNVLFLPSSGFVFQSINEATKEAVDIPTLTQAYERYNLLIFNEHYANATQMSPQANQQVSVKIADISEAYPQFETDESYSLSIPDADGLEIEITASTVYGAIRALETLSQLVSYCFDSAHYHVEVAPVTVQDTPRYGHRGLMLDTSRHYQTLSAIKQLVESMAYAKFNVLHWHMSDSQSFPFQSTSYPLLWEGAYSKAERYRQEDVADVVEFARLRGIKVMVEFDMPGHAGSWCKGYPQVCPSETCTQPLDPSTEATFDLIDSLIAECTDRQTAGGLFPYSMVHLGGDEVSYSCWEKSEHIQAWAQEAGMTGSEDIYEYFVDRAANIVRDQQRTPVQWVEVFEHFGSDLDNNTIIHIWKDKKTMTDVISAGYRALLSDNDLWYLDHLGTKWDAMYNNEPTELLAPGSDLSLLLGGEACMWAETVDISDLEETVWPRAAAVAERLWTPEALMDVEAAEQRIETFRCLLMRRGVAAAPVTNREGRKAPRNPGSCYLQRR